jgi:hypothetical protein
MNWLRTFVLIAAALIITNVAAAGPCTDCQLCSGTGCHFVEFSCDYNYCGTYICNWSDVAILRVSQNSAGTYFYCYPGDCCQQT